VEEQTDAVGGREQLADILAAQSLTVDLFLGRLVPTQARLDEIRAQLLADVDDVVLRTTRHILVDTLDEAESLLEDLEAGADFAALAAMHSTDVGSGAAGGDLGPALPGSYVPAFEEAVWSSSLNEIVGPIETNFGFHLLEVTAEQTTPAQDLDGQLADQVLGNDLDELLRSVQAEIEITVAPGLGVWDPVQGRVVAG
jgi:peptidyl-prolyl cis-trans isomerase C